MDDQRDVLYTFHNAHTPPSPCEEVFLNLVDGLDQYFKRRDFSVSGIQNYDPRQGHGSLDMSITCGGDTYYFRVLGGHYDRAGNKIMMGPAQMTGPMPIRIMMLNPEKTLSTLEIECTEDEGLADVIFEESVLRTAAIMEKELPLFATRQTPFRFADYLKPAA